MSKKIIRLDDNDDFTNTFQIVVPSVDSENINRRIKIYDPYGDYWFREIGFNRKIIDSDGKK